MSRPTVRTPEVIRKIEEVAAMDGTVEEMAFYADIHPDTLYSWMKDDKELSDRIDALRQRPFLKARQTLIKNLDTFENAMKYMERKKKKEFALKTETDITSNGETIKGFTYVMPKE